jgi:hypothetical protein
MAEKQVIYLAKSAACTGIAEQLTPIELIDGISERGRLKKFIVDIENNTVLGIWDKIRYNNKGVEIQRIEQSTIISDLGEMGMVEYDETLNPVMSTYVKEKDEQPIITNYFKQLGSVILTPMVSKIGVDNGYIKEETKE